MDFVLKLVKLSMTAIRAEIKRTKRAFLISRASYLSNDVQVVTIQSPGGGGGGGERVFVPLIVSGKKTVHMLGSQIICIRY